MSASSINTGLAANTVITVDGPSGAGKGTLSYLLARKTGFHLLDSGALYRLVALASLQANADLQDQPAIEKIAETLNVVFDTSSEPVRVMLNGQDATLAIREEKTGMTASIVAAYPGVRAALLTRQRAFALAPGLIADGRDMGTCVFPNADLKFFLTASAEARAERRYRQLIAKGESVDKAALVKDIQERDERDSNRSVSPLKPAVDAIFIDSTEMTIDEVLNLMLSKAQHLISRSAQ